MEFRMMAVKMFIFSLFDRLHFYFNKEYAGSYKFNLFRNTVWEIFDSTKILTLEEILVVLGCSTVQNRAPTCSLYSNKLRKHAFRTSFQALLQIDGI